MGEGTKDLVVRQTILHPSALDLDDALALKHRRWVQALVDHYSDHLGGNQRRNLQCAHVKRSKPVRADAYGRGTTSSAARNSVLSPYPPSRPLMTAPSMPVASAIRCWLNLSRRRYICR
ncbi:MAG: hypothetical protein ACTHM1_02845 [Solirubrobacteraceae bacterium]